MIENIMLMKIEEDLKQKLMTELDYNEALNIACNYKNVEKNINLLKSYGIIPIDEIILTRSQIFLKSPEKIAKCFSKFNVAVLVDLINTDYSVVDELFN